MKKILLFTGMLLVLVSSGLAIYLWVIRPDPAVVGSEEEGLEAIRPRNMRVVNVTSTSFLVEWSVNSDVSGYIKYGDTSNALSLIAQDDDGAVASREHRVNVSGLTPGKKYYFWVMSDNIAFGRNGRALEVLTPLD